MTDECLFGLAVKVSLGTFNLVAAPYTLRVVRHVVDALVTVPTDRNLVAGEYALFVSGYPDIPFELLRRLGFNLLPPPVPVDGDQRVRCQSLRRRLRNATRFADRTSQAVANRYKILRSRI